MNDLTVADMSATIRRYFDGCNEADVAKMTSCLTAEATHYFPPGMYGGPFRGAQAIAERWVAAVQNLGSYWTVDNFVADATSGVAVIEWTHFKRRNNVILRGDEWYRFDPASKLITEIRAYYAAPQDVTLAVHQLDGFDYAARGYTTDPPPLPDHTSEEPPS